MYPKSFFDDNTIEPELGHCFVLMPFDQQFQIIYDKILETVERQPICFKCSRADELFGGGHIIEDILSNMARAEIIIADVTNKNPNVFYELGISHMVKDVAKVIIITQDMADVPFDLKQFRCIVYNTSSTGLEKLKLDLQKSFEQVSEKSFRIHVTDGGSYKLDKKLFGTDQCFYSFEMPEVYVGFNAAKFRLTVFRFTIDGGTSPFSDESHGLEVNGFVKIPGLDWELRLMEVHENTAIFRVASL